MSTMKIKVQAIKELESKEGKVTPQELVDAARNKNHPLHNDFEWDDKKAAQKHRLDTARAIIASVRVVITTETRKINCPGYARDPEAAPNEQGYVSIVRLRDNREMAEEALLAEVGRVQSILERAEEFAHALELEREYAAALDAALTLKSRIRRGQAVEAGAAAMQ